MKHDKLFYPDGLPRVMLGAVCGDIAGSVYEWFNIKHKPETLLNERSVFTDDTVMTIAVAEALAQSLEALGEERLKAPGAEESIKKSLIEKMQSFGRRYPRAGYGGSFINWIMSPHPAPYNSWGNGSAMRASYAGWAAGRLEEAEQLAALSAAVTHDHPEGIKGAVVTAGCVYLARSGCTKKEIECFAAQYYDLSFTLDSIRESYSFDVSCPGSVPQAIRAFLEAEDYEDTLKLAISIGGDSDTIAAIAGSIAEAVWGVPEQLARKAAAKLDDFLLSSLAKSVKCLAGEEKTNF